MVTTHGHSSPPETRREGGPEAPFASTKTDSSRPKPAHLNASSTSVGDTVLQSRVRQRRQWVFRTTAMLAVTAVLLSFLVTWRRDEMAVQESLRLLAGPAAQLQAHLDTWGHLPGDLPEPVSSDVTLFLSSSDRYFASQTAEPMFIAYSPEVMLHLKEDGRATIVYEKGKIRTQWMTSAEFREQSEAQNARMQAFEQERRARPPELP